MRGSSDILASLDCHLAVERKGSSLVIRQTKLRHAEEMKPFRLNVVSDETQVYFEYAGEPEKKRDKKAEARAALQTILPGQTEPLSKKAIAHLLRTAQINIGTSTLKAALMEMVETENVLESNGQKNCKLYRWNVGYSLETKSASDTVESTRPPIL